MRPNILMVLWEQENYGGEKLAELTGMEFYDLDTIIKGLPAFPFRIFKQRVKLGSDR